MVLCETGGCHLDAQCPRGHRGGCFWMPCVVLGTGECFFDAQGCFFGRGRMIFDAQGCFLDGGDHFWIPRVVFLDGGIIFGYPV